MKLHESAIRKLLQIYDIYGGHREEVKLREALLKLDMTVVSTTPDRKDEFLVLTEDLKSRLKTR